MVEFCDEARAFWTASVQTALDWLAAPLVEVGDADLSPEVACGGSFHKVVVTFPANSEPDPEAKSCVDQSE